ncbi:hypothetical protein KTD31_00965 [Burkholderia multivorans]|uniref:hypothetical protein n=1 Tax=Burkholderia multivorans TaxID=87883 RepID=UPI001C24AA68|nr:hypothetical protein [Burkholderia multivorans]MBU9199972.1 hypothetical protein [Burkholderia multivorans]MDN8078909.1 hypothetical protein [Burkholderia multivorans]
MQEQNTRTTQLELPDLAGATKATLRALQAVGDQRRVSEVVYAWLKQFNVDIHEDASEQLVGTLLAIVERARAGKDQPTDAEVRASLEKSNDFAQQHNALGTTLKLRVHDLNQLPEVLANLRGAPVV